MLKIRKSFASDNNSGVHPKILEAIKRISTSHNVAYGSDKFTESAELKFKEVFGENSQVFFVFNGTAANVLSIKALTQPYNSVICSDISHLNNDECGAPERFTGCKLLTVPSKNGKLDIESIIKHMHGFGDQHHNQPKVISITQSTEYGTVYTLEEIGKIADFAHKNGMFLHVDGARFSNATASLGKDLKSMCKSIDVLSFGGTKNGMMYGEAVIFLNKDLSKNFKYTRKQSMQLSSKMWFIAAQFEALLNNNLWLVNSMNSNKMAKMLEKELSSIKEVQLTQPVEANAIFATIPKPAIRRLIENEGYFFYVWKEETSEVRWMTSFDTSEKDVLDFVAAIKRSIKL